MMSSYSTGAGLNKSLARQPWVASLPELNTYGPRLEGMASRVELPGFDQDLEVATSREQPAGVERL